MRFYTQGYVPSFHPYFKPPYYKQVGKIVDQTYKLFFDTKTRKHHFVNLRYLKEYSGGQWPYYGIPPTYQEVIFETLEHETEFLKYHPSATYIAYYSCYYNVPGCVERFTGMDAEKFPIVYKNKRWVWKKS